jgi:hypothetical protein
MHTLRKFGRRRAAAIGVLAIAGCYDKAQSGQDVVYSFQLWVFAAVLAAGLAVIAVGALFARMDRFRGVLLAGVGVLLLGFGAPQVMLDRVIVGPDRLYLNTGFWFSPNRHQVRFSDIARATVEVKVERTRSGEYKSYFFDFDLKSGQKDQFPIGDLMKKAYHDILARLKENKVPVFIPPQAEDL